MRKRDGSVRCCIDLRKLNDVTVKDCYPLPLLQDCIDALEGCNFTILDMASDYYQLEVAEEDRDKTAFVPKYGLFSFRRMPFGLCNAQAIFSRSISLVLRGLSWKSVISFLEITPIGNWGVPLCKRDVQSLIGVLNFHRDHIPKFALVAKPLYDIM